MGRTINENIRKIQRIRSMTYYVTLPIHAMRELGWQEHQKVVVELDRRRKRLIVKDWPASPKTKRKASQSGPASPSRKRGGKPKKKSN